MTDLDDLSKQRQTGKNTDLLFLFRLNLGTNGQLLSARHRFQQQEEAVKGGTYSIFLRSDEVKQELCPVDELVQPSVSRGKRWDGLASTERVEDGKEENSVVERVVLERVVKFRHPRWVKLEDGGTDESVGGRQTMEVQRRGQTFSFLTPTQSSKSFSHRSLNRSGESPEHQRD